MRFNFLVSSIFSITLIQFYRCKYYEKAVSSVAYFHKLISIHEALHNILFDFYVKY
jgi:hypothetical protein